VAAFELDESPDAYERVVEELLASPRFGERWARGWLDLARYADSAGYPSDPGRSIWAYRDWVIRAYNANLPFDRFTIDQLAGDLLPNPTQDQLIATAFHRNTMTQNEGGTSDEEYRIAAVIDSSGTEGPSPVELLGAALAGCMAIDVGHILTRGRHPFTSLRTKLVAERVAEEPHRFLSVTLHFDIGGAVPVDAIERAIQLSRDKYCSVWHSLRQDIALKVTFGVTP